MVKKDYSVTLDIEIVDEAKKIFEKKAQKLSPIINNFLQDLIKKEKRKK